MGGRSSICLLALLMLSLGGCEEPEPRIQRIEIASAHRACEEGDACGVVETSCTSAGCKCGVAVNEAYLLDYQKRLAECRGDEKLASCELECKTPFGKCYKGACVLTDEPPELFRRGRSVQALCEGSRGTYVGCPDCPPNERCKSCRPCECPPSHRWSSKGCRAVVQTEPRDIQVETRPKALTLDDKVKARVQNNSKRTIRFKTVCGTPFHRARKKEDGWEKGYVPFHAVKCRTSSLEIAPGKSRAFVIDNFSDFKEPAGKSVSQGTYRFELTYTDVTDSFRHYATVYSTQFDLITKISSR